MVVVPLPPTYILSKAESLVVEAAPESEDRPVTEKVPPIVALFETLRAVVDAMPLTDKLVVVALVVVELVYVRLEPVIVVNTAFTPLIKAE